MRILYIVYILISLTSLPAFAQKSWDYQLNVNVGALSVDSDKVKSRLWSIKPILKTQFAFSPTDHFYLDLGATLETGSNNSYNVDEFSPERELILSRAHFSFRFWNRLVLDLGAINQGVYESPLFLAGLPFVGIREGVDFEFLGLNWKLFAQQAIPSNHTLSKRVSIVEEGTPLFYAETIKGEYHLESWKFALAYTHFVYKNIPQAVINQSRYLGNSVNGSQQDNASYLYQYQGHNTQVKFSYLSGDYEFELKGHYLHNNLAPNSLADAYLAAVGLGIGSFKYQVQTYRSEADATVAYYNSGLYGHNNRKALAFGIEYNQANDFTLSAFYHQQDLIDLSNVYQSKRDLVTLNLDKSF